MTNAAGRAALTSGGHSARYLAQLGSAPSLLLHLLSFFHDPPFLSPPPPPLVSQSVRHSESDEGAAQKRQRKELLRNQRLELLLLHL